MKTRTVCPKCGRKIKRIDPQCLYCMRERKKKRQRIDHKDPKKLSEQDVFWLGMSGNSE